MAGEVTLLGGEELIRKFSQLPGKLQRKALRRGVSKAARVTVRAVKAEAPKETKLMAQAVGYRVYTFRDKSGVGAVIGAKKDVRRGVVRRGRGRFRKARKTETAQSYRKPANYWHLVIRGTKHSRANNFPLRAAQRTRGESIRIVAGECRQQLETETVKR